MWSFCRKLKLHFIITLCLLVYCKLCPPFPWPPPPTPTVTKQILCHRNYSYIEGNSILIMPKIETNFYVSQFFFRGCGLFALLWLYYLNLCTHVRYVTFNINLNLYSKKKNGTFTLMHLDIFIVYYTRVSPEWVRPSLNVYYLYYSEYTTYLI